MIQTPWPDPNYEEDVLLSLVRKKAQFPDYVMRLSELPRPADTRLLAPIPTVALCEIPRVYWELHSPSSSSSPSQRATRACALGAQCVAASLRGSGRRPLNAGFCGLPHCLLCEWKRCPKSPIIVLSPSRLIR